MFSFHTLISNDIFYKSQVSQSLETNSIKQPYFSAIISKPIVFRTTLVANASLNAP